MNKNDYDVVLIGAGIMSATLATLLYELDSTLHIAIIERLDSLGKESSDVMNNAGTGHSAFCELNYTPEGSDGTISIEKAVSIAESFEISKQFWATLLQRGYFSNPQSFINLIPHCSVVFGEKDRNFLKHRYEKLQTSHLFYGMKYSENKDDIKERMPLVMNNRQEDEKIAATYMDIGTDVNFGSLTSQLIKKLTLEKNIDLYMNTNVSDLSQKNDKDRALTLHDTKLNTIQNITTKFVFIGAGGGALSLLQKSGIAQKKGIGGFPVSGQRLVCQNPDIIAQHNTKVYGKAALGAPPMSVPHLDTRLVDGQKKLLFGPYAGFTTKFLKKGSFFDLFSSLHWYNIGAMLWAGIHNIPLTKYLISQVLQSKEDRLQSLREYMPSARLEDWQLEEAGYRVQIIKEDKKKGGILQFGTEVIISEDKTLSTLLGASPGASTAVSIMLEIVEKCFPDYKSCLPDLIPSYGKKLSKDHDLLNKIRDWSHKILQLH